MTICSIAILALLLSPGIATSQQTQGGGGGPAAPAGNPPPPAGAQHPAAVPGIADVIPPTFTSEALVLADQDLVALRNDLVAVKNGEPLSWGPNSTSIAILYRIATSFRPMNPTTGTNSAPTPSCVALVNTHQAYIFHVTRWANYSPNSIDDKPVTLLSSEWYAYHHPRFDKTGTKLVRDQTSPSGDPLIYGSSTILIVSIDIFDVMAQGVQSAGKLTATYSITVTQDTPAYLSNLSSLIQGLGGIAQGFMGNTPDTHSAYAAVSCQAGTKKLPFDMSISEAVVQSSTGAAPQVPSPGNVACSGSNLTTPCSMTRTFTSVDKEAIDVALGLSTPGVRETGYTFSSTTNTVTSSKTTHTEVYAFLDIFPFAALVPKQSGVPHVNLRIPVTSKSLYRPYFGLAENLTGWTGLQKALQLPTGINVFAGMTWMKTQQLTGVTPTTEAEFMGDLKYHRVWKPMFGVEVPVGALASKLGGKGGGGSGSKNANGNSTTH